jgi:hypothetical protein
MRSEPKYTTGTKSLGKVGLAMIQSQENCLSDSHRLTHERWGGDYCTHVVLYIFFPAFLDAGIFYGYNEFSVNQKVYVIFSITSSKSRVEAAEVG